MNNDFELHDRGMVYLTSASRSSENKTAHSVWEMKPLEGKETR